MRSEGSALHRRDRDGARRVRGQSLVEFALLLPLIVVVVFFTLNVGVGLFRYDQVNHAVGIGSRLAGIDGGDPYPGDGTLRTTLRQQLSTWGVTDVTFCNISCDPAADNAVTFAIPAAPLPYGTDIAVTAKYHWTLRVPFFGEWPITHRQERHVVSERY